MTQNVGVAEDLTQQVFFKLFKRLGNLHHASDVNREILRLTIDELLCYLLLDDARFNQTKKNRCRLLKIRTNRDFDD